MKFRAVTSMILILAAGTAAGAQVATPQAAGPMAPADGYRLGVNDEVEVTIFGGAQPQLLKTRIKEDGTITVPYLGAVTVRDRTARELAVSLTEQLRSGGFFTRPVVNVDVTQYVSNAVTLFGEVTTPGIYPLDRPLTVGMMVARAGGTRPSSADYAILRRAGDAVEHRVAFANLVGDWSAATPLTAGDTLFVPVLPTFYVYGQVNAAGTYGIRTGMTIRQALARAGGPTLAGSERNVSVYRGGERVKKVDLNALILENDTLFVHERLF
jgi:polysaccharide export outer membrane protein